MTDPQSDDLIPYTHWAYFSTRESAQACADELMRNEFLAAVDRAATVTPTRGTEWLMRAAKAVPLDDLIARHDTVEAIVNSHGGSYDGGESGWLDLGTGQFL